MYESTTKPVWLFGRVGEIDKSTQVIASDSVPTSGRGPETLSEPMMPLKQINPLRTRHWLNDSD